MTDEQDRKKPSSLDECKNLVEENYLGMNGIHGVGKKNSLNAVRVYASENTDEFKVVLSEIISRCEPYAVDVIIEEVSSINSKGSADVEAEVDNHADEGKGN